MGNFVVRLEDWLATNRPAFLSHLNAPATDVEISSLEAIFGANLPTPLNTLLRWHNGQPFRSPTLFQNKRLLPIDEICDTIVSHRGLLNGGDFPTANWWSTSWLPFLSDGGGNLVVIAAESNGAILEFWKADPDRPMIADSLSQWISQLLVDFDSERWIEFRDAYIPESELASHMAWDKVDVVLERMPADGLQAIKLIKETLKLDMGVGKLFSDAKKSPVTLLAGIYYTHALPAVANLAIALNKNSISIYPENERDSPLPQVR